MSATHPRVKDDHAAVIGLRTAPMGPDASWERPWGAPEQADEVLIALSISAVTNPLAERVLKKLDDLRGCDAHFSVILSEEDEKLYKRLGIHVSCQPRYEIKRLYHK